MESKCVYRNRYLRTLRYFSETICPFYSETGLGGNMTSSSATTSSPSYGSGVQTVDNNNASSMAGDHRYILIISLSTIIPAGILLSLIIIAVPVITIACKKIYTHVIVKLL